MGSRRVAEDLVELLELPGLGLLQVAQSMSRPDLASSTTSTREEATLTRPQPRKSSRARTSASGCSYGSMWPALSTMTTRAPGIIVFQRSA